MHGLKVNKTKLTSKNTFIVNLFALENEKQSKKDERTLFWDSLQRLDLSIKLYFKDKKKTKNKLHDMGSPWGASL